MSQGSLRSKTALCIVWLVVACGAGESRDVISGRFAASPVLVDSRVGPLIVVADKSGTVTAIDPDSESAVWRVVLPAPKGQEPYLLSTPVATNAGLVVLYQTREKGTGVRRSHRALVIDLDRGELNPALPMVEFSASIPAVDGSGLVRFNPPTSQSRAALAHGSVPGKRLGFVYASFGNRADIQPWHGWIFELDLDAWQSGGAEAAISATFLVTPETHCPVEGQSGSADMICGGGVWTPAGPLVVEAEDGFDLFASSGNGQLDLARRDYSNSLMRLRPGLDFDPECDPDHCREFDPLNPAEVCMASCRNLFIPRQLPGDPPLRPASGICEGMTFLECYARIDYDFGASAPAQLALANGLRVMIQPGKDGHVYLFDADQLGELYDREQIVSVCGAPGDLCEDDQWRGMILTQPTLTVVDGLPIVLVPTFMFDHTHPAGVVALAVHIESGRPKLEPFWQAPAFDTEEARLRFRFYSSRVALSRPGPEQIAYVVDVVDSGGKNPWRNPLAALRAYFDGTRRGTLLAIRVRDGEIVARTKLLGSGRRHVMPLLVRDKLFIPSGSALEVLDLPSPGI